jgi:hypothetical protein
MRLFGLVTIVFAIISCESRVVKYAGLNDLVVGVQQIVLYEDNDFYLELGLGGTEGTYTIKGDTVYLYYEDKPQFWPDKLLMTDSYFITINSNSKRRPIKIRRWKGEKGK